MNKKFVVWTMAALLAFSATGCGGSGDSGKTETTEEGTKKEESASKGDASSVANKDKPLVWFNRQPSNSSTGELDMNALNFNKDTYYVGFDANQGAELQGQMVKEYIEKNADTIDRNGDGVIGYVLAIGDIGHNDSIARTRGVRKALGTGVEKDGNINSEPVGTNVDGKASALAIGDIGHNDSIARTRGVRKALGTGVEKDGNINSEPVGTNVDGKASAVQDGTLEAGGKKFTVRELGSQEMKNSAGATWDAATAGNAIGTWSSSFGKDIDVVVTVRELGSQEMKNSAGATWDAATAGNAIGTWSSSFGKDIDVVVSNNDGMGMSMFNAWSKDNKVPTFGYDANSDAVAAIAEGYGGTISQHADVQAYLTLRVLRNALDGVDIDTGIGTADEAGNVLSENEYRYSEEERSYYALNVAVTADNYKDFTDSTKTFEAVSNQLDESKSPKKKVWLNIYNASDNFLSSTYQPLLQNYDDLLNLDVEYIGGDGQTESNITNRLGNPGQYDAFAINMVKTDNAASYTALLNQ